MRLSSILLAALALYAPYSTFAQPPKTPPHKTAFDKPTLEAYVRHRFFWGAQYTVKIQDPKPGPMPGFKEVIVEVSAGNASQQVPLYVSDNGLHIVMGEVYDIAKNPFQRELTKLKTASQPGAGTAGAPVVLVMFSDFQCTFCREEAKVIRENLEKAYPAEVRLYFEDYPLESIHPWAKAAAIAGRCVFSQNAAAFWDYHDWMFDHQTDITADNLKPKVLEFAATKSLDPAPLTKCIDNRSTEGDVNKSIAEGKSLGVDSTPTLFLNGRKLVGKVEWTVLKQLIDEEIQYQKTAKNAGDESCCEVKLPSPFKN